jgi:hypothetical protein
VAQAIQSGIRLCARVFFRRLRPAKTRKGLEKAMQKLSVPLLCLALASAYGQTSGYRTISLEQLRDKIQGGWAGQMIGVSYGAPTEFRWLARINNGELPAWTPERLLNALEQDDLYVDMTFAKVLDDKGLDATTEDFGALLRDAKYDLWHANLAARRNIKRGVPASLSGTPKYNAHANDIDFQIEADFIGLMAPGLPQASNEIAWRAGRVMDYGDGIYGGMFVSCMYASAFFENDPRKVVEAGLECIPSQSPYARIIRNLLAWSKQYPDDWKKTWQLIEDQWDRRDPCPSGALRPFNIDAKLNGAYLALGLLYGNRDFGKTIEIATRAGQDSDCNPASAGGVLGVVLGYKQIPTEWKSGVEAIADRKFKYTDFTFRSIVASTEKRAIALVQRNGGRLENGTLIIKIQHPKASALQLWDDYGSPVERVGVEDPRWSWKGTWLVKNANTKRGAIPSRISSEKAAEASISFEGTGAIVVGPYLPTGGKADVYLDGKFDRTVDVYPDEDHVKLSEAVWHAFGLRPGKHTVRLLVRGEPYSGSRGAEIQIEDFVVFR